MFLYNNKKMITKAFQGETEHSAMKQSTEFELGTTMMW